MKTRCLSGEPAGTSKQMPHNIASKRLHQGKTWAGPMKLAKWFLPDQNQNKLTGHFLFRFRNKKIEQLMVEFFFGASRATSGWIIRTIADSNASGECLAIA